ncbi:hypothetical protein [Aeromonas rivuli]|uniref:hypothetical protein n=1 Tax=Aeromonas rivuli TaxID=648794 RepID=UPI001CCBD68E|nr:hypothetical protein [Aeromonas rivuli]UBO72843.1 hypothetical protein KYK33_13345 [Aeromonas rivuli]
MTCITLISLLHRLSPQFPIYPVAQLLFPLSEHEGEVWLPPLSSPDVAALRAKVVPQALRELASLSAGWCDFAVSDSGDTPELDALANYDEEMLDNLRLYWGSAAKINHPITDNLFELRRGVVDEAHGSKLAQAWERQQELRFAQLMTAAKGQDLLCFVEVESAYWLRQRLSEQAEIVLHIPAL